jgi:hypothetical protein
MLAVMTAPSHKRSQKQITPKMQRYAELRAQGLTQSKAALEAGYSAKQAGNKIERNPFVQRYLSNVRSNVQARVCHTVEIAMDEAKDTMQFAREKGNPMAYCKAVELRAKLSGLLIDRVEVFTADLKGALLEASKRIIDVTPDSPALQQLLEAGLQAPTDPPV